jgi:hypothetical protein
MAITPVPSAVRKVHIYQLCNRTRLESLIVLTSEGESEVSARLKHAPPPEASLWRPDDDVDVETMAQHMTEPSAEQFLKMYLEHMQRRTWRFKVWRV